MKGKSMSFPYWDSLVTIGKCIKPHGLHGEIRVKAITDFPERFEQTEKVFAHQEKDPVRPLEIASVRENHGGFLIKFVGIDSLTEADKLRGHFLSVPDDELVALEEDEYWHWQLEGLRAVSPGGGAIGVLKEVVQSPAHDLYLIEDVHGKTHWVPAVRQYVPEIDIENGRVVVILPEFEE
jgi:16S rRNA processing protein RimM